MFSIEAEAFGTPLSASSLELPPNQVNDVKWFTHQKGFWGRRHWWCLIAEHHYFYVHLLMVVFCMSFASQAASIFGGCWSPRTSSDSCVVFKDVSKMCSAAARAVAPQCLGGRTRLTVTGLEVSLWRSRTKEQALLQHTLFLSWPGPARPMPLSSC